MAFAFTLLATRGGRLTAAVAGLALGLPVVFWLAATFIPKQEEEEDHRVRIEVRVRDARTGMYVPRALVRVYNMLGDRELPDGPAAQTVAGVAFIEVQPVTARSERSFLRVDAVGYVPFRATLVELFARGDEQYGEYTITAELMPEGGG